MPAYLGFSFLRLARLLVTALGALILAGLLAQALDLAVWRSPSGVQNVIDVLVGQLLLSFPILIVVQAARLFSSVRLVALRGLGRSVVYLVLSAAIVSVSPIA